MTVHVAKERVWRSADVDDRHTYSDGHPKAAFLLAAPGDPIPAGYDPPQKAYETYTEKVVATEVTEEKVAAVPTAKRPPGRPRKDADQK